MSFFHTAFTLVILFIFIGNYLVPLFLRRRQFLRSKKGGRGFLCLTYGDGPDEVLTKSLTDLFDSEGVRATFYFVGFRAERNPEICRHIKGTNNEIGCHTYTHLRQRRQSPWKALKDVQKGYQTMAVWLPEHATYRPPFGQTHLLIIAWLLIKRRKIFWWTHDSYDTRNELPDSRDVVEAVRSSQGGVVLLHSFHKETERQKYVLEVTRRLIELAKQENYNICTASEYLNAII